MTADQLREAQRKLRMTNREMCRHLDVAETTLCNWKAGRIPVPQAVVLALKYMETDLIHKHITSGATT